MKIFVYVVLLILSVILVFTPIAIYNQIVFNKLTVFAVLVWGESLLFAGVLIYGLKNKLYN